MSQYQIKRDRERKDAFKVRCATRSRSDLKYPSQRQTSCDLNSPPQTPGGETPSTALTPQSAEIKRDDTGRGNDSLSDLCLSPDVPVESPYADKNPYSCLQVDSPTMSERGTLSLKNDSENEELYEAGAVGPPVESQSQIVSNANLNSGKKELTSREKLLLRRGLELAFRNKFGDAEYEKYHPIDDKSEDPT